MNMYTTNNQGVEDSDISRISFGWVVKLILFFWCLLDLLEISLTSSGNPVLHQPL